MKPFFSNPKSGTKPASIVGNICYVGTRIIWDDVSHTIQLQHDRDFVVRESSIVKRPWPLSGCYFKTTPNKEDNKLIDKVVLEPSLLSRIENLAKTTANTRSCEAPFRNMLFFGPPGTGKTLVANQIAKNSGLEYALISGGDVLTTVGGAAASEIHHLFDAAKIATKGFILVLDDAHHIVHSRQNKDIRSCAAVSALLSQVGEQSRDVAIIIATNRRSEELELEFVDKFDEVLEFQLPALQERLQLFKLYLQVYNAQEYSKKADELPEEY